MNTPVPVGLADRHRRGRRSSAWCSRSPSATSPQLGLDLQGGASVVLQPKEGSDSAASTPPIDIIRNRVDGLGVAEPEITRQGDAVVVEPARREGPGPGPRDRGPDGRAPLPSRAGGAAARRGRGRAGHRAPPWPRRTTVAGATTDRARRHHDRRRRDDDRRRRHHGAGRDHGAGDDDGAGRDHDGAQHHRADHARRAGRPHPGGRAPRARRRRQRRAALPHGPGLPDRQRRSPGASKVFEGNEWQVKVDLKDGQDGIDTWNVWAAEVLQPRAPSARPGSWPSCSTATWSRPRRCRRGNFADDTVVITGGGTASASREAKRPGPGAALRLAAGRARAPGRADRVGHPRARTRCAPASSPGWSAWPWSLLFMILYYRALGLVVLAGLGVVGRAAVDDRRLPRRDQRAGPQPGRGHRHHRVDRRHRRLLRRVLRAAEGRRSARARRCGRRSTEGFTSAYRTILAADIVSLIGAGILLVADGRARCGASPSSSACRPCSTSSSPTSSPGRWSILLGRSRLLRRGQGARCGPAAEGAGRRRSGAMTASHRGRARPRARGPSLWHRLYHGETTFDFVGQRADRLRHLRLC